MDNSFSKKHTTIAKGFAMILMLFDHLFWLNNGNYISVFPLLPDGSNVEYAIGSIGNICVAMFLTLSGYGMYCVVKTKDTYTFKEALIRIRNIWINYALITIMFIIIDLIFGKITIDPVKMLLNLLVLDFSYNNYAWFMITYIVIMLVFPLCHWVFKRVNWFAKIIIILMIKGGITVLNMGISHFIDVPEIVYKTFIEPFMFLPAFLIGYICAEYDVFRVIYENYSKGN